jgi:hypothetical protein
MIKYQYQTIRYVHDRITGEFVNVGLLMFEPTSNFLECKVINKYARISHFFGEINGSFLLTTLKQFQNQVMEISKSLKDFRSDYDFKDISTVTDHLLPKDDSALVATDVKFGLDINVEAAFEDMYHRIIEAYNHDGEYELHTDHYAWQKIYKRYFDRFGVTQKLKKHSVRTERDTIDFDKAWKNGVWNCYQTLSFDLKKIDSIKNKVYKWSGVLKELETSNEPMKLYFLTTAHKANDHELDEFIKSTLTDVHTNKIEVSVITETEAENFASKVRKDMLESNVL